MIQFEIDNGTAGQLENALTKVLLMYKSKGTWNSDVRLLRMLRNKLHVALLEDGEGAEVEAAFEEVSPLLLNGKSDLNTP